MICSAEDASRQYVLVGVAFPVILPFLRSYPVSTKKPAGLGAGMAAASLWPIRSKRTLRGRGSIARYHTGLAAGMPRHSTPRHGHQTTLWWRRVMMADPDVPFAAQGNEQCA